MGKKTEGGSSVDQVTPLRPLARNRDQLPGGGGVYRRRAA